VNQTKFTAQRRDGIVADVALGLSRNQAAARNGVGQGTLSRWIAKGRDLPEDSSSGYRKFYDSILAAETELPAMALHIVRRELDAKPELAWRIAERTIPRLAPPQPKAPAVQVGPTIVQLSLSDGSPLAPATMIEVGDATEVTTGRSLPEPA
jgi:hypothetical protein